MINAKIAVRVYTDEGEEFEIYFNLEAGSFTDEVWDELGAIVAASAQNARETMRQQRGSLH